MLNLEHRNNPLHWHHAVHALIADVALGGHGVEEAARIWVAHHPDAELAAIARIMRDAAESLRRDYGA